MYVTDNRRTSATTNTKDPPPFPTYDVKIIAGRRVVIFHDRKQNKEQTQPEPAPKDDEVTKDPQNEDHLSTLDRTEDSVVENGAENMLATKAASVPSSRSRNKSSVPPHPGYHNGRKLSLSDTFTVKSFEESKYPILPPLTKSSEASDADVDARVKQALSGVNERSLEAMLREMRKLDRDRDGVLPPANIEKFLERFKIMILGVLDHLYRRFADDKYPGMINYEFLLKYLLSMRPEEPKEIKNAESENNGNNQNPQKSFNPNNQRQVSSQNPGLFGDRGDARLILDLEETIANSPKFDLGQFRSSLESKDMYGNEQVSKQHVIQAANNAKLVVSKEVLKRWLSACDPIKRGIYSIPKLVNFLERSQPNVISRMKSAGKALSKSHGSLSYGRLQQDNFVKAPPVLNSSASEIPLGDILKKSIDKSTDTQSPRPQNLQDLNYLKQALVRSHQETPGYLKADDVRHVCSSYSAAFQMNISNSRVQEAISNARSMDSGTDLINIGLFCRFLDSAVNK